MNEEFYHLPITTAEPDAARAIHAFAQELVSHGANARVIFDAFQSDPDCPMAHAYAGALFLTQMTREGQLSAGMQLAHAERFSPWTDNRERATIAAVSAWCVGDLQAAVKTFRAIVEIWPHDLVALKLCQLLELSLGDFSGMQRTSGMAAAISGRSGYALGMHAFALEQNGHPELACRFASRANDLNPGMDPWAQHGIAHALVALDQPVEARAFLHAAAPDWDRCSSFMLTHNWWHLALLELELHGEDRALALFDERVWGVRKAHCQDQVNAISLLARLEMQGVDSGWRWDDLARHVAPHVDDAVSPFLDLHYLIALVRAGQDEPAQRLLARFSQADGQPVAAALANGVVAHARGDADGTVAAIAPVCRHISEIGGSNVQRELFELMFVHGVESIRLRNQFGEQRARHPRAEASYA